MTSPDDILDGRPARRACAPHGPASPGRTRHLQSPFVAPMRLVPFVGRQVRSVDALSNTASKVADTGIEAVDQRAGGARRPPPHRPAADRRAAAPGRGGRARRARARAGSRSVHRTRSSVLSRARATSWPSELERTRDGLGRGAAGARAAADLLAGPRRYLILAANNAEMRSGSGMFLSAGVMTTSEGSIDVGDLTSTTDLDAGARRGAACRATSPIAGAGCTRRRNGATWARRRAST